MMQLIPTETNDWVNPKDFNLNHSFNDIPTCGFLEVKLDYPDELHDFHNGYQLVGEKIKVTEEMLSKYPLQSTEVKDVSFCKNKKLIANLGNQKKYKLTVKT